MIFENMKKVFPNQRCSCCIARVIVGGEFMGFFCLVYLFSSFSVEKKVEIQNLQKIMFKKNSYNINNINLIKTIHIQNKIINRIKNHC